MKRTNITIVITLVLTVLYMSTQASSQSRGQIANPNGTALVEKLPDKVQGIRLTKGRVKLKPGYKFVKAENGSVTVARIKGSGGIVGTWSCSCDKAGGCTVVISTTFLVCGNKGCTGTCALGTTVDGVKKEIIRF
jgi:hypothetical protein